LFPPFRDVHFPYQRTGYFYQVMWQAAEYVGIAVLLAVTLRDKLTNKLAMLGFATVATLLVSPTLIVLRNQIEGGTFDQPVWRFGLAAVPAIAVLVAAAGRSAFARWSIAAVTAVLYVSAIWVVFRPPSPV
jgi:hypothetical protein